jgi:thioredoxin reductase
MILDILIIGAGPGGLAAGYMAQQAGKSYLIIEKGRRLLQGIIDSYPKGKRVYPTIPKGYSEPFAVSGLEPPPEKIPVEAYVDQVKAFCQQEGLNISLGEAFQDLDADSKGFVVRTSGGKHLARNIILAFGSNIPNDLGIYGEAKTVARNLESVTDYIGVTTLVIGGGNAAADVVAAVSRVKREANDASPVYWGHLKEKFEINKDTARDLGEEILLGGQIRILQGAIPKIGEVDTEGIDRLYIHQSPGIHARDDVYVYQGMSFPMKNVIACIGTHGPAPIFNALNLQQITCMGDICKIAKEGEQLLLLTSRMESSRKGIYAIGGSISPSYMEARSDGTIMEKKHSNLIYTAIQDAATAIAGILASLPKVA